jgi:hypothetical protein
MPAEAGIQADFWIHGKDCRNDERRLSLVMAVGGDPDISKPLDSRHDGHC